MLPVGYVAHVQISLIHLQITFDCIKSLWVAIKLFLKDEYQVDRKAGWEHPPPNQYIYKTNRNFDFKLFLQSMQTKL